MIRDSEKFRKFVGHGYGEYKQNRSLSTKSVQWTICINGQSYEDNGSLWKIGHLKALTRFWKSRHEVALVREKRLMGAIFIWSLSVVPLLSLSLSPLCPEPVAELLV